MKTLSALFDYLPCVTGINGHYSLGIFLILLAQTSFEQTVEVPVIWDAMVLIGPIFVLQ